MGDRLYVLPNFGQTLQQAAQVFANPPASTAGVTATQTLAAAATAERWRIEVWERGVRERFVTTLGEYEPRRVKIKNVRSGELLEVTFPQRGGGLSIDAVWAVGAAPGQLAVDTDKDKIPDPSDNCPEDRNAKQEDTDQDGIGDACDNPPAGCGGKKCR